MQLVTRGLDERVRRIDLDEHSDAHGALAFFLQALARVVERADIDRQIGSHVGTSFLEADQVVVVPYLLDQIDNSIPTPARFVTMNDDP